MTNALIIVDVQNDFTEGGSLAVAGGAKVAQNITEHLKHVHYDHIITTQDWHINPGTHWAETPDYVDTWPVHCEADTHGADYHPDLKPALETNPHTRVLKGEYEAAYSGFEGHTLNGDTLHNHLKNNHVTDVTVVGIATDHCVYATAKHALEHGYNTTIITNLTAGVNPERTTQALQELKTLGATLN